MLAAAYNAATGAVEESKEHSMNKPERIPRAAIEAVLGGGVRMPRSAWLRPKIDNTKWPEAVQGQSDTFSGEPLRGPLA